MTDLIIKTEILAGSTIDVVVYEMSRLSKQLKCGIEGDFNGFPILIYPHTKPSQIIGNFYYWLAEEDAK